MAPYQHVLIMAAGVAGAFSLFLLLLGSLANNLAARSRSGVKATSRTLNGLLFTAYIPVISIGVELILSKSDFQPENSELLRFSMLMFFAIAMVIFARRLLGLVVLAIWPPKSYNRSVAMKARLKKEYSRRRR